MDPWNKAWSKGRKVTGPDLGNGPEVTYIDFTPEYVVLPTLTVLVLTKRGRRSHAYQMDRRRETRFTESTGHDSPRPDLQIYYDRDHALISAKSPTGVLTIPRPESLHRHGVPPLRQSRSAA